MLPGLRGLVGVVVMVLVLVLVIAEVIAVVLVVTVVLGARVVVTAVECGSMAQSRCGRTY